MIKKITGIVTAGVLLLSVSNFAALGDNDLSKAVIKSMRNKVEVKYGPSLWREASMNQLVRPGTSIRTGKLSRAELLYPDGTITRVGSRTSLIVLEKSFRAVRVESGKMWFKVTKKSAGLRIYSPTAVAAITGTEGFAQFGKSEPEQESNSPGIRLASNDKNFAYKIAEANGTDGFSFGLSEGTANVFKSGSDGEPTGDPTTVTEGQLLTFSDNNFNLQNVGTDFIIEHNSDVSQPDAQANNNNNPSGEALGPSNASTENVPNNVNSSQDLNKSPTTGDLQIIIK